MVGDAHEVLPQGAVESEQQEGAGEQRRNFWPEGFNFKHVIALHLIREGSRLAEQASPMAQTLGRESSNFCEKHANKKWAAA